MLQAVPFSGALAAESLSTFVHLTTAARVSLVGGSIFSGAVVTPTDDLMAMT